MTGPVRRETKSPIKPRSQTINGRVGARGDDAGRDSGHVGAQGGYAGVREYGARLTRRQRHDRAGGVRHAGAGARAPSRRARDRVHAFRTDVAIAPRP